MDGPAILVPSLSMAHVGVRMGGRVVQRVGTMVHRHVDSCRGAVSRSLYISRSIRYNVDFLAA